MTGAAADAARFPYHRSLAPLLWVLFGLSLVEMAVVHALLAVWWPKVAIALSIVSVAGMLWLVRLIRSFRRLPVLVADGVLTMRAGRLLSIAIPVAAISGLRGDWSAKTLKARGILNLGLLAYPNIVIDLTTTIMTTGLRARPVRVVAHRLDDPEAFRRWIATLPHGGGLE